MTLANKITTGRLALAVVLFVLFDLLGREPLPGWPLAAVCCALFVLVTATDALDGYYARKLGQVSDFGRIADPAADKVIICGSFVFLSAVSWGREIVPPWIVVTILCREFIVTALRGYMERKGHDFGADPAGKMKMMIQCIAVPSVLCYRIAQDGLSDQWPSLPMAIRWVAIVLVWATLLVTVWSGLRYVRKAAIHLREGL
ncbi:MAG: CDP-diacylglycerol--glycerol-3-phosphate 3-phosphatidyltransferase [Planctomycetes bacterium]|nr:CDP-diacylglycerol--glycerol-3-phosphate 3-phosphatidyltransferase [Planctomycetota bacterium]